MDILKQIKRNRLPKEILCFIDLLNKSDVSVTHILVVDHIRTYFIINTETKTIFIYKWNIYYYFADLYSTEKWKYSEYEKNVNTFISNTIYNDYETIWI